MGTHSTQELIEFCLTKIDEGLPILRAFCGSAIISNDLRSHRRILRRTLVKSGLWQHSHVQVWQHDP